MKTTGLVICIALALFDLAGAVPIGGAVPPVGVIIAGLVLGLATLAAMVPAWRGSRAGLLTVVVSRAVSALLGIGAFFDDSAPGWVGVSVIVGMVVTAVAVVLLMPTLLETRATRRAPA
ncbi:hypothetical protein KOI35_44855 [Actinoplanes bogorensis]|uniref:Integral membrane protein n=1 Tax=Paractinoplanes bogorensis TaxID=1610840 RepID=A0ABS5Z6V0_9ACTN|nr:hypothetical protein [Actinoplanes bogorensis]MBU2670654.1 hypothetical protein [Actinoplanes bogorensis]